MKSYERGTLEISRTLVKERIFAVYPNGTVVVQTKTTCSLCVDQPPVIHGFCQPCWDYLRDPNDPDR